MVHQLHEIIEVAELAICNRTVEENIPVSALRFFAFAASIPNLDTNRSGFTAGSDALRTLQGIRKWRLEP
jgi:hypothetical protein